MKKYVFLLSILTLLLWQVTAQAQIITTVAGGGNNNPGDGGQAIEAKLQRPTNVAFDAAGNIFISDRYNHRIRKKNISGIITTIAGNGVAGYSGDSGPAITATINEPYGIAVDGMGNIYFSEVGNNCIRKISISGIISTIAGIGIAGYNGDGIQATTAQLGGPGGIAVDDIGNIYVSDFDNNRIRKVSTDGVISTFAGTGVAGYAGDGGPAILAQLNQPGGITIDAVGNIYISEAGNNCIRKIDISGVITTVVGGNGAGYSGDGGDATLSKLRQPIGLDVDATGNIYIADTKNHCIRMVNSVGIISTIAGMGTLMGFEGDGGNATTAKLSNTTGITIDSDNNIYIADWGNNRVRTLKVPTSITDIGKTTFAINVYPNPSAGQFAVIIEANVREPINVYVHDIMGRKIVEFTHTTNKPIAVHLDIPTGVYILSANVNGVPVSQKISIIK